MKGYPATSTPPNHCNLVLRTSYVIKLEVQNSRSLCPMNLQWALLQQPASHLSGAEGGFFLPLHRGPHSSGRHAQGSSPRPGVGAGLPPATCPQDQRKEWWWFRACCHVCSELSHGRPRPDLTEKGGNHATDYEMCCCAFASSLDWLKVSKTWYSHSNIFPKWTDSFIKLLFFCRSNLRLARPYQKAELESVHFLFWGYNQ